LSPPTESSKLSAGNLQRAFLFCEGGEVVIPVPAWPKAMTVLRALATESGSQESGQALIEYLFTIVFVALVAMVGLKALGPKVSDLMASITF